MITNGTSLTHFFLRAWKQLEESIRMVDRGRKKGRGKKGGAVIVRLEESEWIGEDTVRPGDTLDINGFGCLYGVEPGMWTIVATYPERREVKIERLTK